MKEYMLRVAIIAVLALGLTLLAGCGSSGSSMPGYDASAASGSSIVSFKASDLPDTMYIAGYYVLGFEINNTGAENFNNAMLRVTYPAEITYTATEGGDAENTSATANTDGTTTVLTTLNLPPNTTDDVKQVIEVKADTASTSTAVIKVEVLAGSIKTGDLTKSYTVKFAPKP